MGPAALNDVTLPEFKRLRVLVDIVGGMRFRQSADNEEAAIVPLHAARAMYHLRHGV